MWGKSSDLSTLAKSLRINFGKAGHAAFQIWDHAVFDLPNKSAEPIVNCDLTDPHRANKLG